MTGEVPKETRVDWRTHAGTESLRKLAHVLRGERISLALAEVDRDQPVASRHAGFAEAMDYLIHWIEAEPEEPAPETQDTTFVDPLDR